MGKSIMWASDAAKALVMITGSGFYLVDALDDMDIKQQAKDHGELNPHIIRIEDMSGQVLWNRL